MSVFLEHNHLFIRDPHGGAQDVGKMLDAGFRAIFCNIGDFAPEEWVEIRDSASKQGAICGPWLRTSDADSNFVEEKLDQLIEVADQWGKPFIVNAENELDQTGGSITSLIAKKVGKRDAAISTLAWPMNSVDWAPLGAYPVLPQIFGPDKMDIAYDCKWQFQALGVPCVVFTFGAYSGWRPTLYDLHAPFGVFAADDVGNAGLAQWRATGTTTPCNGSAPPPDGGGDMQVIGTQHGITAAVNRMRTLDPSGTLLVADSKGKWPSISTLTAPLDQWKAYDKLERTLLILRTDHDDPLATTYEVGADDPDA
jgi:hypothetical protein